VTTRVALDRLRATRRRREVLLDHTNEPAISASDGDLGHRADLERALRHLPDTLRTVFVLREVEGLSHGEIAETLGIRVGASEVRLHRALKKLRAYLAESR
jgi:RNA polymerase sigma-70 factor (ECF subfamily)